MGVGFYRIKIHFSTSQGDTTTKTVTLKGLLISSSEMPLPCSRYINVSFRYLSIGIKIHVSGVINSISLFDMLPDIKCEWNKCG